MGEYNFLPFFLILIKNYIYHVRTCNLINKKFMKSEYKEKALSHLEGIVSRNKIINEMLSGNRPADQKYALRLSEEIKRLSELLENLMGLS